jgi:hypothetical protein
MLESYHYYWVVLVELKYVVFYRNSILKILKEITDLHKDPEKCLGEKIEYIYNFNWAIIWKMTGKLF